MTVFGVDKTAVHAARLYNYLGLPDITGTEFQQIARAQVQNFGANLVAQSVNGIEQTTDGFAVTTESGEHYTGNYLIVADGQIYQTGSKYGANPYQGRH